MYGFWPQHPVEENICWQGTEKGVGICYMGLAGDQWKGVKGRLCPTGAKSTNQLPLGCRLKNERLHQSGVSEEWSISTREIDDTEKT